ARATAEQAVRLDERNPRSRALFGDVLAALGDWAGAQEQFRVSLRLRPDPGVERRMAAVASNDGAPTSLLPAPPPAPAPPPPPRPLALRKRSSACGMTAGRTMRSAAPCRGR